jgi:Alpha/beta hydrolase domain
MVTRAKARVGQGTRRRAAGAALVLATGLTLADCSSSNSNSSAGQTPQMPDVEGPITAPGDMFIDPLEQNFPISAAAFGYVFEEYFVSGTAAGESYEVRLLVARPADPSAELFSGHVLVEPKHGTGIPFVWNFTRDYLMSEGHAAVEISIFPSTVENTLQGANPERYADLQIADDQASDVFAQVGRLLKSDQTPLPGAAWLHMTGHSMAVGPVWRFMDTHHDEYRLPNGDPIYDGFFPETTRTASRLGPFPDVDVLLGSGVGVPL